MYLFGLHMALNLIITVALKRQCGSWFQRKKWKSLLAMLVFLQRKTRWRKWQMIFLPDFRLISFTRGMPGLRLGEDFRWATRWKRYKRFSKRSFLNPHKSINTQRYLKI